MFCALQLYYCTLFVKCQYIYEHSLRNAATFYEQLLAPKITVRITNVLQTDEQINKIFVILDMKDTMKHIYKLLLAICLLFAIAPVFADIAYYNKQGNKTGSYRIHQSGNVITQYDKYGSKSGSYRKTGSGYNQYDKYGSKTGSYRKTSTGYNSYDQYARKTGSYKVKSNGTTTISDKYGRKSGTLKKSSSGKNTEYDRYGRKIGSYR